MKRQRRSRKTPTLRDSFVGSVPVGLPSAQEKIQANELLRELQAEVEAFKPRIDRARTERRRLALEQDLDATNGLITAVLSYLAPIRCLPPELLSYIFQISFEDGTSPWTFAQVSSQWRTITFEMPLLWNRISFSFHRRTGARNLDGIEYCHSVDQLSEAFKRCKLAGITLTLNLGLAATRPLNAEYCQLSKALNRAAGCITSLTLVDEGIGVALSSLITNGLSSLKVLTMSGTLLSRCFKSLLDIVESSAVGLHTLTIECITRTILRPVSCWQRLTSLDIAANVPLSCLSQGVNLRTLTLRADPDVDSNILSPPAELPYLEKLSSTYFPINVLRSFTLPALREAIIVCKSSTEVSDPLQPFPSLAYLRIEGRFTLDFSCIAAPNLTTLKLVGFRHAGSALTVPRYLKDYPYPMGMEHVTLEHIEDDDDLIVQMFPRLHKLSFLCFNQYLSTPEAIKHLWRPSPPDGENETDGLSCPSLEVIRVKFTSERYKQISIKTMLQALIMMRRSRKVPLKQVHFSQFKGGLSVAKELVSQSTNEIDESSSDQSRCGNCQSYHM